MASSLVLNPTGDFFSKASTSEQHTRNFNPFVFKPSAQQASNITSVVNQQPKQKDQKNIPKDNADKGRPMKKATSPEKRHISTTSKSVKRDKDASLLSAYGLGHLRGRLRRRMVKSLKQKLRSELEVAALPDDFLEKVREVVLKHAPSSVEPSRQVVQQHLESYVNETDSSSHSSDDNSSEQPSRGASPMHHASTLKKRKHEETEVKGFDNKGPESLKNKEQKRKVTADDEIEGLSKKERKALKKQKRESAPKEAVQHTFAEQEQVSSKRKPVEAKEEISPLPSIKKVRVEETKSEPATLKVKTQQPGAGRINIRRKISKEQIPKAFQALYDDIPDTFKISKAWKEFPRSILSGKTTGSGNMSNYCYFNTAMQMLSHIAPLVEYLVYYHSQNQCPIQRKDKVCVCCEVRDFLLRSYEDQRDGFYILKRLGAILDKRFRTNGRYHEQQDSNDAMLSILEKAITQLKTQQNDAKAATPLEEILSFKNRSTITCKSCHYKSVEETDTLLYIMDIPQGKSELPLMEAYKPSTSDTVHGYKCSKCKKEVEITKRTEIATLPPYLLVLATRNVVFTMPSYGKRRGRRGEVESDPRRVVIPPSNPTTFATSEGKKETYKLNGVAIHQGSSHHGGHWIHLGKLPNGQWACHSDRQVSTTQNFQFPRRGSIGVVFGFSRS